MTSPGKPPGTGAFAIEKAVVITGAAGALLMAVVHGTGLLLALVTGAIVSNINLSIANVALPTIGADLGATQDQLTSIANAFALGLASTVLYLGSIGDRYGRKLLFVRRDRARCRCRRSD